MSTIDPIELQVLTGALRAACEEMGAALIRSAHSPNIKERRDASTALFDARGQMVMQAEHIPVHLGSMPDAVAAVLGEDHSAGLPWMLNDPFAGGTHLPDITLITPVLVDPALGSPLVPARGDRPGHAGTALDFGGLAAFGGAAARGDRPGHTGTRGDPPGHAGTARGDRPLELIGFAASRAHHADVGGRVPGSMPADSRTLAQEGVVISPRPATPAAIEEVIAQMRQPEERRADLRAQLAANRIGALRLSELAQRVGRSHDLSLRDAFDAVLHYAERRTRACLAALPDGTRTAEDILEAIEGDLVLRLRATVEGERLILDFAGSAPQHPGNLNCPLAVTRSACYFAVRVLTDPDIPPSAGAYRPVEVRVPEGTLLNALPLAPHPDGPSRTSHREPSRTSHRGLSRTSHRDYSPQHAPAVAAGNVETSSRVADLVLAAFGRALGQGTMNNLTLGDEPRHLAHGDAARHGSTGERGARHMEESHTDRATHAEGFSYYETLGGGQGACPDADGPSGVHVAMSNTLNTPIEALERELPLRVTHYGLRRRSGGAGAHRGGDGVVRELEALREMTFSLITERRRHPPPGAHGGQPGAPGRNLLLESGPTGQRPAGRNGDSRQMRVSPGFGQAPPQPAGRPLPGKVTGVLQPGQRLRIETPGGGGHGAP